MTLTRIALMWVAVTGLVCAQAPPETTPSPQFEVASVKPFTGGGRGGFPSGGPGTPDMGQFNWPGASLRSLIAHAYMVNGDQVTGPDWISTAMYAVAAKIPAGTTREQFSAMLQNLLTERFRMTLHHETKVINGYDLVLAKGGPKLKESVATDGGGGGRFGPDGATRTFNKATMPFFANMLAMRASDLQDRSSMGPGNPPMIRIVDKTGLTGIYDITLHYALPGGDTPGEDIFSALESQLGLSLKAMKISVDMVVVDRAEKIPTEN